MLRSFPLVAAVMAVAGSLVMACSDGGGGGGAAAPQSCTSDSQCGSGYTCKLQSFEPAPGLDLTACNFDEDPFCEDPGGEGGSGPGGPGAGGSGSLPGGSGSGGSGNSSQGGSGQQASGKCVAVSGGAGSGGSGQAGSSSGGSSQGGTDGGGAKKLGADCTKGDECADGKCLLFTGNDGKQYGFCTRTCVKAEDCPESGWVCNLSPHTACVPDK